MLEERYRATTQNRFYPDMSNVNKNITVEAKLIIPPTYKCRVNVLRIKIFCDVTLSPYLMVSDVSKDRTAFIFNGQAIRELFMDCFAL